MNKLKLSSFFLLFILLVSAASAQDTLRNKVGGEYLFTMIKNHDAMPVQNQNRSGTCWSFSSLSFFESELIRKGKGQHNLSEMYIVRNAYIDKAEMYVRMHGNFNFGAGGQFHDIPVVMAKHGAIPEEVYGGLDYGMEGHNHREMDKILKAMVDAVIKNNLLTSGWKKAFAASVDAYLGEVPETFEYQGKEYTPESYAKELDLNMDDYVAISSFTHHPFYDKFIIEIPDNWALQEVYNVPLEDLMATMDHAIMNGYTFAWGSDVSEKGFSFRNGLAIVPQDESMILVEGKDNNYFSDAGAQKVSSAFDVPMQEKVITQEMRQRAFDNYETTDDHGMHVTGIAKDQNGAKYYRVKNSWGIEKNECDGYFFASEAYMKYKTINIFLHKDALPKQLKKKLGIS